MFMLSKASMKLEQGLWYFLQTIRGTRCRGSVELVFEKRPVTICYKIDVVRKMLQK